MQYLRVAVTGWRQDATACRWRTCGTPACADRGQRAGTVIDGNRRIPIVVRGPDGVNPLSPAEFGPAHHHARWTERAAGSTGRLERESGPVKIDREMGSRYSVVIANVTGRDLVGFVEEAKAKVAQAVKLPTGYRIAWGGSSRTSSARRGWRWWCRCRWVIFVILFSTTFGSVRQALLVLSNIPFALVGGIVGCG